MRKVVVIGGGVSGLTAAKHLVDSGLFDVKLLEADDRIGGRVQTLKLGEHFVENGAQWVHGDENNSIFLKAHPLGLLDTKGNNLKFESNSTFVTEEGTTLPVEKYTILREVLRHILHGPNESNSKPEQPLGEWSEKLFWSNELLRNWSESDRETAKKVLDWAHRFQTTIDGSDNWNIPSCKGQQEYWECPGNPLNAWINTAGYETLLGLILLNKPVYPPHFVKKEELPKWINLRKEVTKVDYSSETCVKIACGDGSIYDADHVICTVSLGVLKEKADLIFHPPLPELKRQAIRHLAIGCVDKLHFEFGYKWWPDGIIGFNLLWNLQDSSHYSPQVDEEVLTANIDGVVYFNPNDSIVPTRSIQKKLKSPPIFQLPLWCRGILGFYVVASHPTALNSWITGPTARLIETLEEETVNTIFMKVLRQFVGKLFEIPEPRNFVRSKWYLHPFVRGSYSFRSVESDRNNVWPSDIASPILNSRGVPSICFGGEASHDHFHSTVHGAHDAGLREATRLIMHATTGSASELSPLYPFTKEMFDVC